jgi:hypothetical protein
MLHTPVITPSQRAAIAHRKRMMNPPDAVPDPGIDLKRTNLRPVEKKKLVEIKPKSAVVENIPTQPRIRDIQLAVIKFFNISLTDLLAHRRSGKLPLIRHIAIHLCKTLTTRSLPEIGRQFDNRDHTTILHSTRRAEELIASDRQVADQVARLTDIIMSANPYQLRCVVQTSLEPRQCHWIVNTTISTGR